MRCRDILFSGHLESAHGGTPGAERQRKKVEMLLAHLKRILKLDRLRLRGRCGARDELHLAATVQNRKVAKFIPRPTGEPLSG